MKEKVLIIGIGGLIGKAVREEAHTGFEWLGTYYSREALGGVKLDITDKDEVEEIISEYKPTHVINCSNLAGGVDFYEMNDDLARKFHFEGTLNIGRACDRHKAKLTFLSSECVFDGKKEVYLEGDAPSPLSNYGKYKAQSEEWIAKNLKKYIIIRAMSVSGWDPFTVNPNAIVSVYFSLLKKEKILVPNFRWGNPTFVRDLSKAMLELTLSGCNGIYHVVGSTFINRYEWLKKTSDVLGWDASYVLPRKNPISSDFLRPFRVRLNTDKFNSNFNIKLHNLDEGLLLLKQEIEEKIVK